MAQLTLKEFAEQLVSLVETDENIGNLTVPIDYQDTSIDTIELENEYQSLLSQNLFQNAYELRKNNPILETRILDSPKLNYLQTLMLTAFQFAKEEKNAANTSYDNSESGLKADNVAEAINEICETIDEINEEIGIGSENEGSLSERVGALETFSTGIPFTFGIDENGNYGYIKDGADTVTPFKTGYEDTPATATAAMITEGFTAWVNGKLITGTRPLPTNTQTGSKTWNTIAWGNVVDFTINFPTEFDSIPSVSLAGSSGAEKGFDQLKVLTVTRSYFTGRFEPGGTPGEEYDDITIKWTASVA